MNPKPKPVPNPNRNSHTYFDSYRTHHLPQITVLLGHIVSCDHASVWMEISTGIRYLDLYHQALCYTRYGTFPDIMRDAWTPNNWHRNGNCDLWRNEWGRPAEVSHFFSLSKVYLCFSGGCMKEWWHAQKEILQEAMEWNLNSSYM